MHPTQIAAERYSAAATFHEYVESARKNEDLWRTLYRTASVPESLILRARSLARRWRLLALSEDWCGDAVSTLPTIARFAELAGVELRIASRDASPDLMAGHLTSGTRSIPVVMALDAAFIERGWWGPRPAQLQRWVRREGLHLPREERYRRIRRWYARDRGHTTMEQVLEMLERGDRILAAHGTGMQTPAPDAASDWDP